MVDNAQVVDPLVVDMVGLLVVGTVHLQGTRVEGKGTQLEVQVVASRTCWW